MNPSNPNHAFADRALKEGYALHQQGRLAEAELKYRQALNKAPDFPGAAYYLGVALLEQNKARDAVKVLEKAIQRDPRNGGLHVVMSSAYLAEGQMGKALNTAEKVTRIMPEAADGYYNLAQVHLQMGQDLKAMEAYDKALAVDPNHVNSLYNKANLMYNIGQKDMALAGFERVIELSPNLAAAHTNAGSIHSEREEFEQAIAYFRTALKHDPQSANARKQLGMCLHYTGAVEEALEQYRKALNSDATDASLQVLLGNAHRDLGNEDSARTHYRKALELDPNNATAKDNLSLLDSSRIASWHFHMLADSARNKAYHEAIKKAVDSESTVLDIGTGSGLLALMAAKAGAKKVVACEMVDELANVAKDIVKENGFEDRIEVHQKKSTSMKVGEELTEKADVYVSEILDSGLLGEGMIPSTRHALQHLVKPEGKVIPAAADVKAVLIESEELNAVNPVADIEGFDLSAFNRFRKRDQYERHLLNVTPHRRLSEEFPVWSIDFKQLPPATGNDEPNVISLSVKATESGTVHAVAFWFDLHVDDEVTLNSGPDGEMIHWGQAVYFLSEPKAVKAGEELNLEALQSDVLLRFRTV